MIQSTTLEFLRDLALHNDRDWFQLHKKRHDRGREEIISLAGELLNRIAQEVPAFRGVEAKNCVYRIYRDTRFSEDKSPYKTHFGIWMTPGGKGSWVPGFYVHVEPGKSFVASGLYMPEPAWLAKVRERIAEFPESLLPILSDSAFQKTYGALEGERLKTAPKGYPKDHPQLDLLRLKSFIVTAKLTDADLTNPQASEHIWKTLRVSLPLWQWLRETLSED